ncbi:unnamed protein product [Porites evermanni]|uniref:Uncharacterized protein n=1 Tax=Porites evermanni TaxID=104178 RepID=A0ABN8LQE5_9CNID|nr:unnamed protein product [Porites evermanni]
MATIIKEKLSELDYESDAQTLAKATRIMRQEIFIEDGFHFNRVFPSNCQSASVPSCLKAVVSVILSGPNIFHQNTTESQASLTISQLIVFNSNKTSSSPLKGRHSLDREPPLPMYIGLCIHANVRMDSMRFTCTLCLLGISVSYDRVENLINGLASTECNRFKQDGVACPLNLNHGLLKQLKPWCPGRYRPQPFFNYSTGFVPWHRNKSFSNPKRHCHPSLVLYESYIGT